MQTNINNKAKHNPFDEGKDEKKVWEQLLKNAKPLKKGDFFKKVNPKKGI